MSDEWLVLLLHDTFRMAAVHPLDENRTVDCRDDNCFVSAQTEGFAPRGLTLRDNTSGHDVSSLIRAFCTRCCPSESTADALND